MSSESLTMISKCSLLWCSPIFLSCIHFLIKLESGCWESGDWVSGHLPPYFTCAVPCTIKYLSPNGDSRLYYYLNNTCNLSYSLLKTYLQVNFFLFVQHCFLTTATDSILNKFFGLCMCHLFFLPLTTQNKFCKDPQSSLPSRTLMLSSLWAVLAMATSPKLPFCNLGALLCMMLSGMEYPSGPFGSAVLVVSLLNFLHTPSPLTEETEQEKGKALSLCKDCSAAAKFWCVTSTAPVTDPKHSTLWASRKKINSVPARPNAPPKTKAFKLQRRSHVQFEVSCFLEKLPS